MIRAVLDTNVLVSAFPAKAGVLDLLLRYWYARRFELAVSDAILIEVARTWTKPYWQKRFAQSQIDRAMDLLETDTIRVPLIMTVHSMATHPEDDLILATVMNAHADYLVTGDRQLLKFGKFSGATILTPNEFLDLLESDEK